MMMVDTTIQCGFQHLERHLFDVTRSLFMSLNISFTITTPETQKHKFLSLLFSILTIWQMFFSNFFSILINFTFTCTLSNFLLKFYDIGNTPQIILFLFFNFFSLIYLSIFIVFCSEILFQCIFNSCDQYCNGINWKSKHIQILN